MCVFVHAHTQVIAKFVVTQLILVSHFLITNSSTQDKKWVIRNQCYFTLFTISGQTLILKGSLLYTLPPTQSTLFWQTVRSAVGLWRSCLYLVLTTQISDSASNTSRFSTTNITTSNIPSWAKGALTLDPTSNIMIKRLIQLMVWFYPWFQMGLCTLTMTWTMVMFMKCWYNTMATQLAVSPITQS